MLLLDILPIIHPFHSIPQDGNDIDCSDCRFWYETIEDEQVGDCSQQRAETFYFDTCGRGSLSINKTDYEE